MRWRRSEGIEWLEAPLPGGTAAFSTRRGGASDPPFAGLNVGLLTDDDRGSVLENRRRLATALGIAPGRVAIGRQVHGAELASHAEPQRPPFFVQPSEGVPAVDGHVVTEPGVAALVFVADCLPVALSGPRGVAMLHCGWRGLAAGILARAVGAVGATDAAVGPGIGACCYEVGAEVREALGDGTGGGSVDLAGVAERMLRDAGVERVEAAGLCTSCEEGLFFSHRRDAGRTGRQAGVVWLDAEEG